MYGDSVKIIIFFSHIFFVFLSNLRKTLLCLYDSYLDFSNHNGFEYAGYLTFLLILSICPFLIILINLGGKLALVFMENEKIVGDYLHIMLSYIPENIIEFLKPRVYEIISGPSESLIKFSILSTIWTSSSIIEGMRTILNRANRVSFSVNYFYRRILSVLHFLVIICIMVVAIISINILPLIFHILHENQEFSFLHNFGHLMQFLLNLLIIFVCTSCFYIIIPNISVSFREVLPGTFFLFSFSVIITKLLTFYISNFYLQINLTYGSLAGIIIVMLFFYLLSIGFIFGAEFNHNYARYFKKKRLSKKKN